MPVCAAGRATWAESVLPSLPFFIGQSQVRNKRKILIASRNFCCMLPGMRDPLSPCLKHPLQYLTLIHFIFVVSFASVFWSDLTANMPEYSIHFPTSRGLTHAGILQPWSLSFSFLVARDTGVRVRPLRSLCPRSRPASLCLSECVCLVGGGGLCSPRG